ncbi:hypothetical protein TNCV_3882121 [Trichonephila clavipes]|nr:hypothetical protein TNCV_3882121 [Trichonephila clavipes]
MLEKVIENWTSRLDYIRASRGSPMPEIIFKMRTPQNVFAVHQSIAIDVMPTPDLVTPSIFHSCSCLSMGSSVNSWLWESSSY